LARAGGGLSGREGAQPPRRVGPGADGRRRRQGRQRARLGLITEGRTPKGDVLAIARLAGIQAAKRTADWIPLAHPLPLDAVEVDVAADPAGPRVRLEARVRAHARTGVEMEALVAVSAAALTIYDMCKAVDRGMTLEAIRLTHKQGGKSGTWQRPGEGDG
jgi:cyclic pyranopterin phosphate synthase